MKSRAVLVALAATVVGITALLMWRYSKPPPAQRTPYRESVAHAPPAGYVGSPACAKCHASEFDTWRGSQHAIAMQVADEHTVLGDFNRASYEHFGVTSTFFRRNGDFIVRTDAPDGRLADYKVGYTFGIFPLQQYLIDVGAGRLQALTIAWDSRPRADGGQRWFSLYPAERIGPKDELHWTRRQQNWNYMCADCHTTDLKKNYDPSTDTFATRWAELCVGCEACHGPGSAHVAWAQRAEHGYSTATDAGPRRAQDDSAAEHDDGLTVHFNERRQAQWRIDAGTGNATRSRPRETDVEIDVCAQCHSRRGQFSDDYHAGERLLDHYRPALLTAPLYYPDGQQRDEDYNWGSFVSSRMYSKGVTCGDCHDPHAARLRASGNTVCAQCHLASRYDAASHHFHAPGSAGAQCVACHMATTTYMVVDPRHDHSFRIPRPDLTERLGVPNSCNGCHKDQSASWAAAAIRKHYPRPNPGFQDFADAFAAADRNEQSATIALAQIVANQDESPIARASALDRLAQLGGENATLAAEAALTDASPLVRMAAVTTYDTLPPDQRLAVVPLLDDPVRAVRMQAARTLAPVPAAALGAGASMAFARAAREYVAGELFNADRPEDRTNLGGFYAERGQGADAEAQFRSAIALDPSFVPAWVNLADLMRVQGREIDAEATLRAALERSPSVAMLHYALGLALVRQKKLDDALRELQRATELDPGNARFAYVYGVAKSEVKASAKPKR